MGFLEWKQYNKSYQLLLIAKSKLEEKEVPELLKDEWLGVYHHLSNTIIEMEMFLDSSRSYNKDIDG